ncbi:hypothetical protein BKA66DRAFT_447860 [Pyrenochaeta sp. MPI-SDFR-AT-0127]|nr:hypothetical protein BKA66DRAFT_447860 [Pyrenochaeta sp. MPI-SDFR-AT-0127]
MPMSWATIAAAPPPSPTPPERMEDLARFFDRQPESSVILDALGFTNILGASTYNAPLIEHTVVIGIDTEAWTKNTNEMTEIGLAVFERKDMVKVHRRKMLSENEQSDIEADYEHLGDFGEELLKKIAFYHLRIVETAHLKTNARWMKGAEGNRFGHSRFVTFAEARDILDSFFSQHIESTDVSLKGCKRPVVLIGHAIYHDEVNFKKHGLNYNWRKHGTIVKEIDTQALAKATCTWSDPETPSNNVGLGNLTKQLGFKHEDAHTACNDAARTVMSAIQMVLPKSCKTGKGKSMQTVALNIEDHSRNSLPSILGSEFCCIRCGSRDHEDKEGEHCEVLVHCKACAYFDKGNQNEHWTTHIEDYCVHVAEYKGWLRRRDNAIRKWNRIPPGPPKSSHPPSNGSEALHSRSWKEDLPYLRRLTGLEESCSISATTVETRGKIISDKCTTSDGDDHTSIARIVSVQSACRRRGDFHGARGMGDMRGSSKPRKSWRRDDDWRPGFQR